MNHMLFTVLLITATFASAQTTAYRVCLVQQNKNNPAVNQELSNLLLQDRDFARVTCRYDRHAIAALTPYGRFVAGREVDLFFDLAVRAVRNRHIVYIKVSHVSSGIVVADYSFPVRSDSLSADLKRRLSLVKQQLLRKMTPFGYPFMQDKYGVVVVYSSVPDSAEKLISQIQTAADADHVLDVLLVEGRTGCTTGQKMISALNAKLLLIPEESRVIVPGSTLSLPLVDNFLPFLPPQWKKACFSVSVTGRFLDKWFRSAVLNPPDLQYFVEQDMENTSQPVLLNTAIHLHRLWAGENVIRGPDIIKTKIVDAYYQTLLSRLQDPWVFLNYGGFCRNVSQNRLAGVYRHKALEAFDAESDTTGLVLALLEDAKSAQQIQAWARADSSYRQVLRLVADFGDSLSIAGVLFELAVIAESRGLPQDAFDYYQASSNMATALNDTFRIIQICNNVGRLYHDRGEYQASLERFKTARQLAEIISNQRECARSWLLTAVSLSALDDGESAIPALEKARTLLEEIDDLRALVQVSLQTGYVYLRIHDVEQAVEYFQSALATSQQLEYFQGQINALSALAELYVNREFYQEGQDYYDRALKLARDHSNVPAEAEILYNKGLAHIKEGRLASGYLEVKQGIKMSNGRVHTGKESSDAFLQKLEAIIGDLQDLQKQSMEKQPE